MNPPSNPYLSASHQGRIVAVTGANGFVGRALVRELEARGHTVRRLVRRASTEGDVSIGDIDGRTDWSEALKGVHCVVHAAARVHRMREDAANPAAEYHRVNVEGTKRLAQAAAAAGVQRLVFLSSIKVNGESTAARPPFTARDEPQPQDEYGRSKQRAEAALLEIEQTMGLQIVIVRPPLVYGPGVGANFARLIRSVAQGIPVPTGGSEARRSLVALPNLVDLLIRCVDDPRAAGRIFLVSDGAPVTVAELAHAIGQVLGRKAWPVAIPKPLRGLAMHLSVLRRLSSSLDIDITATCEALDWSPPVKMADALREAVVSVQARHRLDVADGLINSKHRGP